MPFSKMSAIMKLITDIPSISNFHYVGIIETASSPSNLTSSKILLINFSLLMKVVEKTNSLRS